MYTVEQLALKAHIEKENAEFEARVKANGADVWTTTTVDLDHWAGYEIYNIEQYERYMLEAEYSDLYKEVFGIRPSGYSEIPTDMLKKDYDVLVEYLKLQYESEEETKAREAKELKEVQKRNAYRPNLAFADLKGMMG